MMRTGKMADDINFNQVLKNSELPRHMDVPTLLMAAGRCK